MKRHFFNYKDPIFLQEMLTLTLNQYTCDLAFGKNLDWRLKLLVLDVFNEKKEFIYKTIK